MMIERILITGAAGFIGSNLVDTILKNGQTVLGIDNFDPFYDRRIKEKNILSALQQSNFHFKEGDIRDNNFLNKCFEEFSPGLVVHLAARAGVRPSILNPTEYFDVNVMGTLNLLEVMKKHEVRNMIFASSSSVYGNNTKIPFSESDIVDFPISPYAASKKAGELLCHTYYYLYQFNIFCLRFFTVYGSRQRPDLVIHKFVKSIMNNESILIYGDGSTRRDYTHIDDILLGIMGAIENLKGFDIFNLGESNTISLHGLVSLIEKYTKRNALLNYLPLEEGDVLVTYADIQKAKDRLIYKPVVNIESGLKRYVQEFPEG